jgi:hypothetical protein
MVTEMRVGVVGCGVFGPAAALKPLCAGFSGLVGMSV